MRKTENKNVIRTFATLIAVIALIVLTALPTPAHAEQQAERTVLLYICGSNLETQHAMATYNLEQILRANFSQSGRVKVVVMTGGSDQWHMKSEALANPNHLNMESKDGAATISSKYNQVWEARGADAVLENGAPDENAGKLVLLDGDGITEAEDKAVESADELMSDPETLKAFINYGVSNFPAKKYDLILWDHGGGPNGGFAQDDHESDFSSDTMDLSEIMDALSHNQLTAGNPGAKFDFVDFDACLMGSVDIALLMADVADYYIASPETEPGYGQYYGPCEVCDGVQYKGWLDEVGQSPDMNGYDIGKIIVDDFITFYNKNSGDGSTQEGTLAVIDTKKLADRGLAEALTGIDAILRQQTEEKDASGELPFYDEMTAVRNSIQYGSRAYFDLGNLLGQLPVVQYEFSGGTPELTNQYKDDAVKAMEILADPKVIYAGGTKGIGGEIHVYMNTEGALKIGELRTSGLYIFFPYPGDPGQSNTYWQEIAKAAKILPQTDPRKAFLERYTRTMLDYDLIGKTGQDVSSMSYSGTAKDGISYASLCKYWKQDVEGRRPWEIIVQPLLKNRGGADASEDWMNTLIDQQAKEVVSAKNVTAERQENNYHFTFADVNKRVMNSVYMDLTAELPAAEAAKKELSPGLQQFLNSHTEFCEYHIGAIDGSECIDLDADDTSAENLQKSLIQWMNEPKSEWDLDVWDGKCYAVCDEAGELHAAQVDPGDYSLLVQYEDNNSPSGYSLAGLLFGEDGKLSEVGFIDEETGVVMIEPATLKEDFDFMPVQYIDLLGIIQLQLPMSRSAIHVTKDNYQDIRLAHTDVKNIADIADTDGDGIATDRRVTMTDIYGADMDITDAIITDIADKKVVLSETTFTYNAKVQRPVIKTINGFALKEGMDYTTEWSNASSKNVGTYTVTITGKGKYSGTTTATYKIRKASNPLNIKGKTATIKYSKLKKKNQTLAVTKVIRFTNKGQGTKTYTLASAKKGKKSFKKYFKVNKTSGKLTVKKGLKKGTYKVKIKVKAAGNKNYKAVTKAVTVTVKVRE